MRKVEDVFKNVRFGSIIKIYKELVDDYYYGYMIKYDGKIFKDVEMIQVHDFLSENPSIKSKIDDTNYLAIKYDYESSEYKSSIINKLDNNNILETLSSTIDESIRLLDDKIYKLNNKIKRKVRKIS